MAWWVPLAAAGAQGAASLFGGKLQADAMAKNTRLTNAANMRLAEYAYNKDLEMWSRNNTYNAPQQQMTRLKEAGLNPNLIYGNGSSPGNTSAQMPKYNAPTMDYNFRPQFNPVEIMGAYNNYKLVQAQTQQIAAQTQATQANTLGALIRNEGYGFDNTIKKAASAIAEELTKTQLQAAKFGNLKLGAEITNIRKDTDLKENQIDMSDFAKENQELKFWIDQLGGLVGAGPLQVLGEAFGSIFGTRENTEYRSGNYKTKTTKWKFNKP